MNDIPKVSLKDRRDGFKYGLLQAARMARQASRRCRKRQRITDGWTRDMWEQSALTALWIAQSIEREAKNRP